MPCSDLSHYLVYGTTKQVVLNLLFMYSSHVNRESGRKLHTLKIYLNAIGNILTMERHVKVECYMGTSDSVLQELP